MKKQKNVRQIKRYKKRAVASRMYDRGMNKRNTNHAMEKTQGISNGVSASLQKQATNNVVARRGSAVKWLRKLFYLKESMELFFILLQLALLLVNSCILVVRF